MSFYYLATVYSKYHLGLHAAYEMACEQRALFVKARIPCFSPIVHSHGVAVYGDIDPMLHGVWLADDAPFMALAKALVVVKAPGWMESYGIAQKIWAFQDAGKPVHPMKPGEIPEAILRDARP